MFSSPVISPSTAENCPVTPTAARTPSGDVATSWPATWACPPSAVTSVERIFTAVVLPAPFGPSSANTDPAGIRRSMPSRTVLSPYDLRRPTAETAAARGLFLGVGMTDERMESSPSRDWVSGLTGPAGSGLGAADVDVAVPGTGADLDGLLGTLRGLGRGERVPHLPGTGADVEPGRRTLPDTDLDGAVRGV